jgi:tripartite-type tricarboxylate transporter receptor subunit TctC
VTSAKRSPAYPGVPTVAESGVPGYEVTTWYALMAPRGTRSRFASA